MLSVILKKIIGSSYSATNGTEIRFSKTEAVTIPGRVEIALKGMTAYVISSEGVIERIVAFKQIGQELIPFKQGCFVVYPKGQIDEFPVISIGSWRILMSSRLNEEVEIFDCRSIPKRIDPSLIGLS